MRYLTNQMSQLQMLKFYLCVCDKILYKVTVCQTTNDEIYIYLWHHPTVYIGSIVNWIYFQDSFMVKAV